MAQDQQDEKLRRPGRTALLITTAVIPILAIGYLVTWGLAHGVVSENCLNPRAVEDMSSLPNGYQLVDSQVDPLFRGSTCYYEAPDGQRFQREAVSPFENLELF